jgi:hypothetical protein
VRVGHAHIENDYRVLFTRTTDLVQRLQQARQALSLESAIEQLHGGTEPAHERPEPSGVSRMALFAGCWLQDAIRKYPSARTWRLKIRVLSRRRVRRASGRASGDRHYHDSQHRREHTFQRSSSTYHDQGLPWFPALQHRWHERCTKLIFCYTAVVWGG